jgi:hypothetical protein
MKQQVVADRRVAAQPKQAVGPMVNYSPSIVQTAPSRTIQAKLNSPVRNAIVQGDYMSGDRYTIASALRLSRTLGVLILGQNKNMASALELKTFYEKSAPGRVEVVPVESPREAYKVLTDPQKARPRWIDPFAAPTVRLNRASFGTKTVGDTFRADSVSAQETLRKMWKFDGNEDDLEYFLTHELGFRKDKKYVFLWCKEGGRRAEKAHHFTSLGTWRRLKDLIETATDFTPVAVGDDIGLKTTPSLVRFWKHPHWQWITSDGDTRREQLGLWTLVAKMYKSKAASIGMRSGAIEVPALLGIRTLYLEERGNSQAERMEKWIGNVPGYARFTVNYAPGLKQRLAWRSDVLKYNDTIDSRRNRPNGMSRLQELALGTQLDRIRGIVRGNTVPRAELAAASKTPPAKVNFATNRGILNAREQMLNQIKAAKITPEDFSLREAELQWIIDWIKGTRRASYGPL